MVSGISGALHQSFSTEEEARRVFEEEKEKGTTKIIGGSPSSSTSNPPPTPRAPAQPTPVNSPPSRSHSTAPQIPAMKVKSERGSRSVHVAPPDSPRLKEEKGYSYSSPSQSSHLSSPTTGITQIIGSPGQSPSTPTRRSKDRARTDTSSKSQAHPSTSARVTVRSPSSAASYPSAPRTYSSSSSSVSSSPQTGVTQYAPLLSPLDSPLLLSSPSYEETPRQSTPIHRKAKSTSVATAPLPSPLTSPKSSRSKTHHTYHHPGHPITLTLSAHCACEDSTITTCPHCKMPLNAPSSDKPRASTSDHRSHQKQKSISAETYGFSQPPHARSVSYTSGYDPRSPISRHASIPMAPK